MLVKKAAFVDWAPVNAMCYEKQGSHQMPIK
jgi:hypothetical protein